MNEHESDILIVDEETEVVDNETKLEQNDSKSFFTYDFTQKNKPTKEEKKATQSFVNYNNNNLNKIYKKYDVVETYVPKKSKEQKKDKQFIDIKTGTKFHAHAFMILLLIFLGFVLSFLNIDFFSLYLGII